MEWKKFKLSTLFDMSSGNRLTKKMMRPGSIRFISASKNNNGIIAHVGNNDYLNDAGCLTLALKGSIGACFYQDKCFRASESMAILKPKDDFDVYCMLFIASVIRVSCAGYSFTNQLSMTKLKRKMFWFPVDDSGKPNIGFMTSYIKGVDCKARYEIDLYLH